MSKKDAVRFASAWGNDENIEQAVKALPTEQSGSLESIARIAADLGFEATPEELAEAFEAKRTANLKTLESAEISPEDLEQVAGGGSATECYSDYNPNDWCWFSDRCLNINNFYRARPECQYTYEPTENCAFNDNCKSTFNLNYPTNPKRDHGQSIIPN